jgi:protein involved in polysaccharide export with SLBB domain
MRKAALFIVVLAMVSPMEGLWGQDAQNTGEGVPIQTAFPIKPGDRVQLNIWREEDMSGTYLVSPEGTISLPLLGVVNVNETTPKVLKDQLVRRYSNFLRTPSIDVIVQRRVEIGGSVNEPSLYWVEPTVTVFGALALAGGPTDRGQPEMVELRRDGQVLATFLDQSAPLSDSPLRSGDQLWVPQRGWWFRNSTFVLTGVSLTVSILVAVVVSR